MINLNKLPENGSCSQISPEIADDYFFPERYSTVKVKMARRICANCVELQNCQEYALSNYFEHGILAGMTPAERFEIRFGDDAA